MSFHYVFDNHILMLICRLVSISYGTFLPFGPQNFLALVKKYVPITALDRFSSFLRRSIGFPCDFCFLSRHLTDLPSTFHKGLKTAQFWAIWSRFYWSQSPLWVLGLRIKPLRLLAECRKRRLNEAPLNLRGLFWLLMMDWSKRGNINTAALVTIVQCNTLVVLCSMQLLGPANWDFVTLGPLRCD